MPFTENTPSYRSWIRHSGSDFLRPQISPSMTEIAYAQERIVMQRLMNELRKEAITHFFPTVKPYMADGLRNVLRAVHLAHLRNAPLTIASVARVLDMPRATAERKLSALVRFGTIERKRKRYYVVTERYNSPQSVAYVQRCRRLILQAAQELIELEEKRSK